MIYSDPPLVLEADKITDALGTILVEDLPDVQPANPVRLEGTTPLMERLWRIALSDVESNILETQGVRYLGAGKGFGHWIFLRDIAFSGVLGLNRVYPDLMRTSLEAARKARHSMGFKVSRGYIIDGIDADWQQTDVKEAEFFDKHLVGDYGRCSDDVVWLWCAEDLFNNNGTLENWKWLYEQGTKSFDVFYWPFYDESDGLFRGQASFVDVHFVDYKDTGYPHEMSISDCVMLKATSTNCLYVRGFEVMARTAARLGLDEESRQWASKAVVLKAALLRELRSADGTFVYYKDRHGALTERREALGTALAVVLGVVSGEEAVAACRGFPVSHAGVPLFLPFFDGEKCYHNNSAWPFVDTFFIQALEIGDGQDRTALNAALLARTCRDDGTFHELVDFRDGRIMGSSSQLWTAAAFVDTCIRGGLIEL